MSIKKYNKVTRKFNVEISDKANFVTLKELYNNDDTNIYEIKMFFVNSKSKYGDHYVVYTGDYLVDMPKHLNETFREMYSDNETINDINNGKCGFIIYKYTKNHKEFYSITFVDVE